MSYHSTTTVYRKGATPAPIDWGYSDGVEMHGSPAQRIEYLGLLIFAAQDDSPSNPFADGDCEPPTCVYSGRSDFSDYSDGDALEALSGVSDGWIAKHQKAICKALGIDWAAFHADALREQSGDKRVRLVDLKRDALEEALNEMQPSRYHGSASDYLEALATIWSLRGIVAESWYSTGYSQGDWANGLSVATPSWAAKVGAPQASHAAQCKGAGKLWGAWAWGDVYGYVVAAPPADWRDDYESLGEVPTSDLETLDSCWGYFGSDHAESGLEESAIDAADYILGAAAKRRLAKLGELIRARVPLHLRPALLATASILEGC